MGGARRIPRGACDFLHRDPVSLWLGQELLAYSAPAASFAATFVFGAWVARKARARFVVHGTLVGVAAALLYVAISGGQSVPWAYIVAHVLKVLGGALGGLFAQKRASSAAPMARAA